MSTHAAVFLDRDGVINSDTGYVSQWSEFVFLPGAIEAMQRLSRAGYALIVVTNQSGIARGYYSERDFATLTQHMRHDLSHQGVSIAGVYYCPHHVDGVSADYRKACSCRKPAPGLLLRAIDDHNIDAKRSAIVGDKASDMEAGSNAGITRRFHVTTGSPEPGSVRVSNLLQAADLLLGVDQNS